MAYQLVKELAMREGEGKRAYRRVCVNVGGGVVSVCVCEKGWAEGECVCVC